MSISSRDSSTVSEATVLASAPARAIVAPTINPEADQPGSSRREHRCVGICPPRKRRSRISSLSTMTDLEADCLGGSATASGVIRLAIA